MWILIWISIGCPIVVLVMNKHVLLKHSNMKSSWILSKIDDFSAQIVDVMKIVIVALKI